MNVYAGVKKTENKTYQGILIDIGRRKPFWIGPEMKSQIAALRTAETEAKSRGQNPITLINLEGK